MRKSTAALVLIFVLSTAAAVLAHGGKSHRLLGTVHDRRAPAGDWPHGAAPGERAVGRVDGLVGQLTHGEQPRRAARSRAARVL